MKLKKTVFLIACSLAGAITMNLEFGGPVIKSAAAAEVDGPKVKWLLSTFGKRRALTEGLESLSKEISDATGGNFEISPQYGSILSDAKENLDGLKLGAFEAALVCPIYTPSKAPAFGALDLPLLPIDDLSKRVEVHEGYFHNPVVLAELAKWNAYPLLSALIPSYEIMGSGTPPIKIDNWKGLRVSAAGGVGDLLKALDAVPTTIPGPEVYQSLERSLVDAVAWPPYAFAAYRIHEIADWRTENALLGSPACVVAANKQAYEALPQQYKDLIDRVKPIAYKHQIDFYTEVDKKNEKVFDEKGLKKVRFSEEEMQKMQMAIQPSWDAWVAARTKDGLNGQELLDTVLSLAAEANKAN